MKQLLFSFFLLFTITLKAQLATDFQKIENFIIEEKLDSAVFYLNKLKDGKDKVFLKKMILKDEISYKDYYQFISNLAKRENLDFTVVFFILKLQAGIVYSLLQVKGALR